MSNKLCFIYTDMNGIHTSDEDVSSKNLYNYARVIAIHYSIGIFDKMYKEEKNVSVILKPDTINFDSNTLVTTKDSGNMKHNITRETAIHKGIDNNIAILQLKEDLKNVDIIISHDLSYHIRALQVECFRTATTIDFGKYILIDTLSFNGIISNNTSNIACNSITDLIKKLKLKNTKNIHIIEQIKMVFFKLYENYILQLQ